MFAYLFQKRQSAVTTIMTQTKEVVVQGRAAKISILNLEGGLDFYGKLDKRFNLNWQLAINSVIG